MAKNRKEHNPNWGGPRPNTGPKPKEAVKVAAEPRKPMNISTLRAAELIASIKSMAKEKNHAPEFNPFQLPQFPPGATPSDKKLQMAMDDGIQWASSAWSAGYLGGVGAEGVLFLGYPYLSELAQRPEYRVISETIADDATRKWIDFEVTGDEDDKRGQSDDNPDGPPPGARAGEPAEDPDADRLQEGRPGQRQTDPDERAARIKSAGKTDKVKALKDEMARLGIRDHFYALARDDGFFGRSHLYLNFGQEIDGDPTELKTPIGDGRDAVSRGKIAKGSFKSMKTIEPVWTYPTTYNATNPMASDWYKPQVWYVLGREIHSSRLPAFIGHPVPDLLKPSYSFGGLSLSQMAKPYVDIWLTTRQSVANLIHSFSVMVLSTDMQTILQGDPGHNVLSRVSLFNTFRDNMGTFVINKASEDFKNVSATLSGLEGLQAQAQEHMAAVSRIPLVKLTGISPSGLNASSEGEIRSYYDTIAAYQNRFFRPHLTTIFNFMQLSLWGEIDPEITFEFEPLWELSQKEKSEKEKDDADRDSKYVDMGAFSPAEIRKIKIDDPTLPYTGLDPDDVPDLREEEEQGLEPEGGRPNPLAGGEGGGGEGGGGGGKPGGDTEDEAPPGPASRPGGLPWAGQYEFMRGFDLPAARRDGTPIIREAPRDSVAATKGLRIGSRVRYPKGEDGSATGRVIGFVKAADSTVVVILDTDNDSVSFQPDGAVSTRPVLAGDEWRRGGDERTHAPFRGRRRRPAVSDLAADDGEFHESDHPRAPDGKFGSGSGGAALNPAKLKRVGDQMGSNPGGVFESGDGKRYYVKKGKSEAHVKNELLAASLYKLSGTPLLNYKPVEGGKFIATEMAKLDKDNAAKLSPAERREAQRDFAAHAWLANWDAVGLGGDNLGTVNGKPTALDLGGALEYRAQGAPKGKAFGDNVTELKTLRDKNMNRDSAGIFGDMTPDAIRESAKRVTSIPDDKIRQAVKDAGVGDEVANRLIARRNDIAKQTGMAHDEANFEEGKHPRDNSGKFAKTAGGGGEGGDPEESEGPSIQSMEEEQEAYESFLGELESLSEKDIGKAKAFAQEYPESMAMLANEDPQFYQKIMGEPPSKKTEKEGSAATPQFKSKKEHAAHLLEQGTTTKAMLDALGWPSISMPAMAKSLGMKLEKIKINGVTQYKGTPMTAAEKQATKVEQKTAPKNQEEFGAQLADAIAKNNDAEIEKLAKANPLAALAYGTDLGLEAIKLAAKGDPMGQKLYQQAQKLGWKSDALKSAMTKVEAEKQAQTAKPLQSYHNEEDGTEANIFASTHTKGAYNVVYKDTDSGNTIATKIYSSLTAAQAGALELVKPAEKATPEELEKAKKTTAVQLSSIAPQGSLKTDAAANAAQSLVDEFNKKYANTDLSTHTALSTKVADYKKLTASIKDITENQMVAHKAAMEAMAAKQKAKDQKEAESLAKELGSPDAIKHYKILKGIQTDSGYAKQYLETAEHRIKKSGLEGKMAPAEGALIVAYVGSHYGPVNEQLREGVMDEKQWAFAEGLSAALDKMPVHTGYCQRGANIPNSVFKKYQPGAIVPERGFTSAGKKEKLWGDITYHITSKTGRDLKAFNTSEGGGEIVFKPNTYFKITKVDGKNIHMEEMSLHG